MAEATRATDRRPVWAAVALAAAIGVMYAGVWASLVAQWSSDDNYSHGFFVVPLALYFAWERREAFARAPVSGGYAGLVLLGGSLLVWMAGTLGSELFLTRVSMIGVIWGAIWFVWSARHARIMAFPARCSSCSS
jgi:exosortase